MQPHRWVEQKIEMSMHQQVLWLSSMSQRKKHLSNGILIGMGMMIIILGFWGWLVDNYLLGTLSPLLEECGIDVNRHYIFNDLNYLMNLHMFTIVIGLVSLLVGVILERFHRRNENQAR